MSRYLLDTSALIDFSKGYEPARSRILSMIQRGDDVGVCAVIVAEFYAGMPPDLHGPWDEFIAALRYWDIPPDAAVRAGHDRYHFARRGKTLSTADVHIAATARHYGATLITNNAKDFSMEDIELLILARSQ